MKIPGLPVEPETNALPAPMITANENGTFTWQVPEKPRAEYVKPTPMDADEVVRVMGWTNYDAIATAQASYGFPKAIGHKNVRKLTDRLIGNGRLIAIYDRAAVAEWKTNLLAFVRTLR